MARRAAGGKVVRGSSGPDLVVAVPVVSTERVIGVVRASVPARSVWFRVLWAWGLLLGVTLFALATAVLVARRQARALSTPVEALSRAATQIAAGDLGARAGRAGSRSWTNWPTARTPWSSSSPDSCNGSAIFSANASHQLRTALTGLQLGLEAGQGLPAGADLRPVVREALEGTRHLEETVEEVLRLARADTAGQHPVPRERLVRVLDRAESRWHGVLAATGRRLEFRSPPEPSPSTSPAAPPGRSSTSSSTTRCATDAVRPS
ncbi:histidine kinase dimerization/phospho-acceptor domain-containing protein [Streptomyces cirratus]